MPELVGIVALVLPTDPSWLEGSDESARQRLADLHQWLVTEPSPAEVFGGIENMREVFLKSSKLLHPSRFARRPEELKRLATEIFILVQEAQTRGKAEFAGRRLEQAKEGAEKAVQVEAAVPKQKSEVPDSSPSAELRKGMSERRRAALRDNLGRKSAAIRAITEPESELSSAAQVEEQKFDQGLRHLADKKYTEAFELFKGLAVARPSEKSFRMHMHYAQGKLAQGRGEAEAARAEFKRALGFDANFTLAHEALESLPEAPKSRGIFSKLFGKS